MNKILYIVRGLPDSGKTTFAKSLGEYVFAADDFFEDGEGNYNFDTTKLGIAHQTCFENVKACMEKGIDKIFVANTFTRESEINPYIDLARSYGYMYFSIVVENRSGTRNIHGVPLEVIENMKNRFSLKLGNE